MPEGNTGKRKERTMTKAFPTAENFFYVAPDHMAYTLIVITHDSEINHEFANLTLDEVKHVLERAEANGHLLYVTYFMPSIAEENLMYVSLESIEY